MQAFVEFRRVYGAHLRVGVLVPLVALIVCSIGLEAAAAEQADDTERVARAGAGDEVELRIWNRPIVTYRAKIGVNTPRLRAVRAERKIAALSFNELQGSVTVQPASVGELSGVMVMLDNQSILSLVPEDVDPLAPIPLERYGEEAAERLGAALDARSRQQQLPVLLRGAAFSVGATLALALVVWLALRLRGAALRKIASLPMNLTGKRIFEIELGPQIIEIQSYLVRLVALGVILATAYLWLTFVFSEFPYTEPWGDSLGDFLVSIGREVAQSFVDAAPGLATVAVIFLLTRFLVRIFTSLFASVERGIIKVSWLNPETARATRRLLTIAMWAFAVTVAYPYIPGSETEAFKGVTVLLGLMISLGSTGLVNQLMSGLVVVYSGAVRPGEYVRFGEIEGTVSEVGLLASRIVTARREEVSIPNSLLVTDATVNYSRLAQHQATVASTTVTIGYDTPWRQVHAMLIAAASRTEGIRADPPPVVRQTSLADFYVEYTLMVRLERPEMRLVVLSDLRANILDAFNEYGVQIMSPHFESQPREPVVVPKDRWHAAPAKAPDASES
jgi:small-conductance mechanosensitive channel